MQTRLPLRALVALVALLSFGCPDKKPPEPTEPIAAEGPIIIEVRGDVTQGGKPLVSGAAVVLDTDIIVREGRATIQLPDGATLRLYDNTRVRLPQKQRVRLFVGKVWALIAPRFEDRFEVETDNAVAGVRGTELIVEASEKRTRVAVVTGEVEVANVKKRTAKTRVTRGQEVVVQAEAPPTEPAAFEPEAEEKAWQRLGELDEKTAAEPDGAEPDEPNGVEPDDDAEESDAPAKRRPKNRLEREGEETKRRLIEEGKAAKRKLEDEEAATRRKLKEDEKRAKEGGSVKDFLD